jgi:hypothetical protein
VKKTKLMLAALALLIGAASALGSRPPGVNNDHREIVTWR